MTEEVVDQGQSAPQGETTEKPVCRECGTVVDKEQVWCPQCGIAVDEDEVEESLIHWGDEIVYPDDMCS